MMKRGLLITVLFASAVLPRAACARQEPPTLDGARTALHTGHYPEAIDLGQQLVALDPSSIEARRVLARALGETGRYADAIEAATGPAATAAALANLRGEMLLELGKRSEAEAAFRQAARGGGPYQLTARANLAVLLYDRGEREAALDTMDLFIDVYNNSPSLSSADLIAVGTAVKYLGVRNPDLFKDALRAYDEAAAADPVSFEPQLLAGNLFLDKYNSADAEAAFTKILAVNPSNPRALLGMARAKEFDGELSDAFELVNHSLEINPQFVPAHVMLARLLVEEEDNAGATAQIEKALAVNPTSLEALSVLAAIHFVEDDRAGYEDVRSRVLSLNPRYGGLYTTVAEIAANHRRYAAADSLATAAVALSPEAWSAYGLIGLNQLRLGLVDQARANLEKSFAGDPYNAWIKNTLDLLDTFSQYRMEKSPHFEFMLHGDEADLLFPYISTLAEEAYDSLTTRYGYRPVAPIRVEVYPRAADFSVRTVGMVGLGALGVTFGNVLALDSPRAREAGDFNWGTTLWHELAHVVTMGLSHNRVPRWFTEGLSVYEERRAREGWGSETSPEFIVAYASEELPPVSRLNEGFTRPPSPQDLALAYHEASLVVDWIVDTHGFAAITEMLEAYAQGSSTEAVFQNVLNSGLEDADHDFDTWLRNRYSAQFAAVANPREFAERQREIGTLISQGKLDEAVTRLQEEARLFPGATIGGTSPYSALAAIELQRGDSSAAVAELTRLTSFDENAYEGNRELADLLLERHDTAGAAAALGRTVYIYPYDPAVHVELAQLDAATGRKDGAVRERRAVVALQPADQAEALYQLAVALLDVGDQEGAHREVLRALEVAPGFQRAQELLLRLRE